MVRGAAASWSRYGSASGGHDVAGGLSGPEKSPYQGTAQAADLLLTGANQIRRWANAGVIPAHRVPGTRRYWFMRET